MDPDRPLRRRSRSPQPANASTGFRLSPFFAPPGWQPPPPRPDCAVVLQIDLSLMKHLALLDNYYDILALQVYTHLTNDDYTALFTLYKVIYPNYASRHYVQDLYELIVDTFLKRWSLHIRVSQLILSIATPRGKHELNHMQTTILDVLQLTYPRWQTHQLHPYRRLPDSTDIPHGNSDATAFVLYITCEPTAPAANLDNFSDASAH